MQAHSTAEEFATEGGKAEKRKEGGRARVDHEGKKEEEKDGKSWTYS